MTKFSILIKLAFRGIAVIFFASLSAKMYHSGDFWRMLLHTGLFVTSFDDFKNALSELERPKE